MRGNILPAADTCAVVAAVGRDHAAGDVNVMGGVDAIHVLRRFPAAAADTGAAFAAVGRHSTAENVDLAGAALIAAANAGGPSAAVGLHRAGVEVQLLAAGSASTGADARAACAAGGHNGAAPVVRIALRAEVDIHTVSVHISVVKAIENIPDRIAAADACGLFAALTRHRRTGSHQNMHLIFTAIFLDGCASGGPLQGAVPADEIQIGLRLAIHLDGRRLCAGAHINIQAVNENMRRGGAALDLDLFLPAPLIPQLIRHR